MKNSNEHRSGQESRSQGAMEQRTLGQTGEQVSAIGLGGFHLALPEVTEPDAIRIVRTAVDRGITFLDNCWDYNEGESERRMGKALRDGYRDKVFLMTKFDGRTKESALKQLDESLERLQTDRVDLWQFHETIRLEDPDRFFAEGGAVEAVAGGEGQRQDPSCRLYRPQGSAGTPTDAGGRRRTRISVGYRTNAHQRDGRTFP